MPTGWREQADGDAYAAAPAGALSPEVIARLPDRDVAVVVVRDQNDSIDFDLTVPDE
jgi:hypothetical protein